MLSTITIATFERVFKLRHGLITLIRCFIQRLEHYLFQLFGKVIEIGSDLLKFGRRLVYVLEYRLKQRLTPDWSNSRQTLIYDTTERINIGAGIDGLATTLFGTHVCRTAKNL